MDPTHDPNAHDHNVYLTTGEHVDHVAETIDHVIPGMMHNHELVTVQVPVMETLPDGTQHEVVQTYHTNQHHELDADLGGVLGDQQHMVMMNTVANPLPEEGQVGMQMHDAEMVAHSEYMTEGGMIENPQLIKSESPVAYKVRGKRISTGTAGSQPKRRKYNVAAKKTLPRWNDMCYQLLHFRSEHGHCMVPFKSGGDLGKWVATQRAQFVALQKRNQKHIIIPGHEPSATEESIADQIAAGLDVPDVDNGDNSDPNSPGYMALDPTTSLDHPESLTNERVKVLSSVGFVWDVVQADNDARWRKRYEELVEYKNIHGHCNVPQSTDLGKWVKMQRENKHESDLKREGKTPHRKKPKPCLSEDRIAKLEAIGFQWRVAKPAVGWDRRYQQLLEYKEKHGDCNVPQSYLPDKPFGRWVMKQRCQQSLKLRGEKSQLTEEREKKLTDLGFSWVAPGFSKKTVQMPMTMDENGMMIDGTEMTEEQLVAHEQQQALVDSQATMPVEIHEFVQVSAPVYDPVGNPGDQSAHTQIQEHEHMTYTVDPTSMTGQEI
jgi:Helicase associated domain